MKLKSMIMKSEPKMSQPVQASPDQPLYEYGLRICLNNNIIKVLGLSELPEVGEKMKLEAIVEVCSVSKYESKEGGPNLSMDLQITEMGLAHSGKEASEAGEKLYGELSGKEGLDLGKGVKILGD